MRDDARILVTGSTGMVGGALSRLLRARGFRNLLTPSRGQLDLENEAAVDDYFAAHRPEYVFMLAAKVGGIAANIADPVGFLADNARQILNLFAACRRFRTRKNVFLGSSCMYPRECPQPLREEFLMTGRLEPTNEGYALAKLLGVKLAESYTLQHELLTLCPVACNAYGTGDRFDLKRSHVLSALVKRFVDAREEGAPSVTLWGSGHARREFIHSEDLAAALLFLMEHHDSHQPINVGTGVDESIESLAARIAAAVGYEGTVSWDTSRPEGMPRKLLDVSRLRSLGFETRIPLEQGIAMTIEEYRKIRQAGHQA